MAGGKKSKEGYPRPPDDDQRINKQRVTKIGRDAGSGRFTSVDAAKKKPATHVVETIKKPPKPPKPAPKK